MRWQAIVETYTLKLEIDKSPFGSAVKRKDDNAMAASRAIMHEDMNAKPLFARE